MDVPDKILFQIHQLDIFEGDRIGLVGRNGSGKTSLLRIMAGELEPTLGKVYQYGSIALLPQLKPRMGGKSGGEVSQFMIDQVLAQKPELLLADEPTTHLDIEHIRKLEKGLKRLQKTMLLVSHDRAFLDAVCTKIWEIDDGKVHEFMGNYSAYERQRQAARMRHVKKYERYVQKRKQFEEAMYHKEQKAQRMTKKPKKVSASEARIIGAKPYFAKKQKKLNQGVKALQTRLEQLEKVERPRDLPPIQMEVVAESILRNRTIIQGEKVEGRIGERVLWKAMDFVIQSGDKVAVIGDNGSGKTTFLQKILHDRERIRVSPAVTMAYFSQTLDELNLHQSILENVRQTSVQADSLIRTVLARLGFLRDQVFKTVTVLSGGERVKVAIAKLLLSQANLLILDEPTHFLDVQAMKALESLLIGYSGTIIFVSHDRRFLEKVATRLFHIEEQSMVSFMGPYTSYREEKTKNPEEDRKDDLLRLETKIAEVLSRLSLSPSEELDQEFQQLLRQKKELDE